MSGEFHGAGADVGAEARRAAVAEVEQAAAQALAIAAPGVDERAARVEAPEIARIRGVGTAGRRRNEQRERAVDALDAERAGIAAARCADAGAVGAVAELAGVENQVQAAAAVVAAV